MRQIAADADLAVAAARAAFQQGTWAHLAPAQRKRVLIRFADLLLAFPGQPEDIPERTRKPARALRDTSL